MNHEYHSASHCRYLTQYHIIWCPKFGYPVFNKERAGRLKKILQEICLTYHYTVKALEVMPDHIHIFVDVPQTVAPCDVVRTLKSLSAVRILSEDSELRKFYAKYGVLWNKGHFVSSAGHISEETVQRYIEEQKHHGAREA